MKLRLFCLLIISSLLVACAGIQSYPSAPAPVEKTKKSGGYYLDDGPGDNPPANLDALPDAVPKVESLIDRANKPYVALGNTYTPMTQFTPYKKTGVASWYGRRYHGRKTSTGEVYDMYGMTGAHPILPLPSYVRVTNPVNQKSVIVRINDRGPFHSDRLIDLSYAAAHKLGILGKGSGLVEVEAIDAKTYVAQSRNIAPEKPSLANDVETKPLVQEDAPAVSATESRVINSDKATMSESGIFVQVGAFKLPENASGLSKKIIEQNIVENAAVRHGFNDGVYRVRIGPYTNRTAADRAVAKIKELLGLNSYIIEQP
jgi:rare lipoprotein A